MSTATATKARTTKSNAKATARSASSTAKSATARTRRETRRTEEGVLRNTRRILDAAQTEFSAVASQPTRPFYFALGVVDRATAHARTVPGTVGERIVTSPTRARQRIVGVFADAGDLAEAAQRRYTEVAEDGQKLVRSVRRQESTQKAVKFAERAQDRAARSVQDAEKAVEAGAEAAGEALEKLG